MGISCIFLRSSVKQLLSFWIGLSYNEYYLLAASKSILGGSLLLYNTGKCLTTMLLSAWILTAYPRSFEKESVFRGEKIFCFTSDTCPQRNSSSLIPNGDLLFLKVAIAKKKKKKQLGLCCQCLFYVEQYTNTKELRARTVVLCSFSSGNAMRKWPKHVDCFPLVA